MNPKILIVGALAVVALLVAVVLFPGIGNGGNDGAAAEATIYVKDVESGAIISADIDLSKPDLAEQMMLSFGQGIRKQTLEPLAGYSYNIPDISKTRHYEIAIAVDGNVVLTYIQNVNWLKAEMTGTCSASGSSKPLLYTTSSYVTTVPVSQTTITVNMLQGYIPATSPETKAWSFNTQTMTSGGQWWDSYNAGTASAQIMGINLDGMKLTVSITGSAQDKNNAAITSTVISADLTLSCSFTAGTMSVAVSNMGVSQGQMP